MGWLLLIGGGALTFSLVMTFFFTPKGVLPK